MTIRFDSKNSLAKIHKIIDIISKQDTTLSELAYFLHLSPKVVSRYISHMQKAGAIKVVKRCYRYTGTYDPDLVLEIEINEVQKKLVKEIKPFRDNLTVAFFWSVSCLKKLRI